jgi:hypothetical protein
MQANAANPDQARHDRSRYLSGGRCPGYVAAMIACALMATAAFGCTDRHALEFSPATLPDAQVGQPYSATITVSQAATPVGGAGIQDGVLPAGLDFALSEEHDNTMQISGAPTAAGTFHFTVSVWCYGTNVSGQTGTHEYTLIVK